MESRPVRELIEESRRLREESLRLIEEARKASDECECLLLASEDERGKARGDSYAEGAPRDRPNTPESE